MAFAAQKQRWRREKARRDNEGERDGEGKQKAQEQSIVDELNGTTKKSKMKPLMRSSAPALATVSSSASVGGVGAGVLVSVSVPPSSRTRL